MRENKKEEVQTPLTAVHLKESPQCLEFSNIFELIYTQKNVVTDQYMENVFAHIHAISHTAVVQI